MCSGVAAPNRATGPACEHRADDESATGEREPPPHVDSRVLYTRRNDDASSVNCDDIRNV
ncbi:hypothetical protein WN48_03206 [Eufriesea mexicana]|nr:hypothetical protein WN48_03206 [Eufriesea mexicana]